MAFHLCLRHPRAGNAPARKTALLEAIRTARDRGILAVALTQCLSGGIVLGKYAVGAALVDAGVVSGGDMTCEACTTKLAYLFGRGLSLDEIAAALPVSLRGEISDEAHYTASVFSGTGRPNSSLNARL